ncbi:MAG: hypothetical protein R3281_09560, partial [Balneolaceae bacterium]|nr:hypothetical protein [Balneolaceae bacterium]
MINILVTGVGGPTPRSFVRAVKQSEHSGAESYRFIGADCDPLAYGLYDRRLFERCYLVPRADHRDYWARINEIIDKEQIRGAVVLPEAEVLEWARNSEKLERNIKLHLPPYRLAAALTDKHSMHEYLEGTAMVPKFGKIEPDSYHYNELAAELGDSFWVRSTQGSSGLGSLKIDSESALRQWLSINEGVDQFIATEYLPGRNMACKMLYFDGDLKRSACAERVEYIMAKVAPSGITGNTSFGRLINEPSLVERSRQALEMVARKTGTELHGVFTVDYKEDSSGDPKITEINIRHVAFTSSIAAGGANLPLDTLEALFHTGTDIPRIDYQFSEQLIFLRDVDADPLVIPESELLHLSEQAVSTRSLS